MIKITKTEIPTVESDWRIQVFGDNGKHYTELILSPSEFEELKNKIKEHD